MYQRIAMGYQEKGKPLVLPWLDPQCRRIWGGAIRGMYMGNIRMEEERGGNGGLWTGNRERE